MAQISHTHNFPNMTNAEGLVALKKVAIEYGWKNQIEDPENPGELIDNPVSAADYLEAVERKSWKDVYRKVIKEEKEAGSKSAVEAEASKFDEE